MFRRQPKSRAHIRPLDWKRADARHFAFEPLEERRMLALTDIESGLDQFVADFQAELNANAFTVVLPLLGDALATKGQVLDDLADLLDGNMATDTIAKVKMELESALGIADILGGSVVANGIVGGQGGIMAIDAGGNMADDADTEITFLFQLRGATDFNAPFNIGLDALNLNLSGDVNVTVDYTLGVAIGFDATGVFFDTNRYSDPEFALAIDVTLPGTAFTGDFGFFSAEATDLGSTFSGDFEIDLTDDEPDGKLRPNEEIEFDSNFTGTADVLLRLTADLGTADVSPRLRTELNLDWTFSAADAPPTVKFDDIEIDLGPFFSGFVQPVVENFRTFTKPLEGIATAITEPIGPIVDLYNRIPNNIQNELGIDPNDFNLLNLARRWADYNGDQQMLNALELMERVANIVLLVQSVDEAIGDVGDGTWIDVGSFDLAGSNPDLRTESDITGFMPHNPFEDDPRDQAESILSGMGLDFFDKLDDLNDQELTTKSELTFLLLDMPSRVFALLLGQQVDLARFQLMADGSLEGEVPIFAFVSLLGKVDLMANLDVRYDTLGFATSDALNGFYVNDASDSEPEFQITPGFGVRIATPAGYPVRAGIDATIEGNLPFEIRGSGQVRFNDILNYIQMGPLCVFEDINSSVDVVGSAFIRETATDFVERAIEECEGTIFEVFCTVVDTVIDEVQKVTQNDFEIARVPLTGLDFSFPCDDTSPGSPLDPAFSPELAREVGTELVLNVGDDAMFRNVNKDDIDENYIVEQDGDDVVVRAFGWTQRFTNGPYTLIRGSGGSGFDTIDLTNTTAPSRLEGGDENDILRAGHGAAELHGNDGEDRLYGGPAQDKLFGGNHNDTLVGGGDSDELHGNAGNDLLEGDGGTTASPAGDFLYGGIGDDELYGDGGNDLLEGDAGDDKLVGGGGEDDLFGGDDNDVLIGGADNDFVSGGANGDIVLWLDGHGSDIVTGGGAEDILIATGSSGADSFAVDRDGTHLKLSHTRNVTSTLDVELIENVLIVGGDASDEVEVADLFSTDVTRLFINTGEQNDTIRVGVGDLNDVTAQVFINTHNGGDDKIFVNDAGTTHVVDYDFTIATLTSSNGANAPGAQPARTFGGLAYLLAESFDIEGTQGDNVFNIFTTLSTTPLDAKGNAGDDVFNIGSIANSLDFIQGEVTINGNAPSASDVVNINDQGDTDANTYEITSTTINRTGAATITYGTVEHVTINAGSASDTFNVRSTLATTPFTIFGNAGADVFNFGSLTNSLDNVDGAVTLHGNAHPNRLTLDVVNINDQGDLNDNQYRVTSTTVERTGAGRITYATVESLVINASLGRDLVNIESTLATTPVTVHGNAGNDIFNVATGNLDTVAGLLTIAGGGDAGDHIFLFDQGHDGDVDYVVNPDLVTSRNGDCTDRAFKGVRYDGTTESLTLNGTQAANEFIVAPSPFTTFTINGNQPGPGELTRDYLEIVFDGTSCRMLSFSDRANGNGKWEFMDHQDVNFTSIEKFNYFAIVATGADAGGGPHVKVFDAEDFKETLSFFAYNPAFTGGVRVTTGDINDDGIPDIITTPGYGGGPHVRVFDAATGEQLAQYGSLANIFPFDQLATFGVYAATADFDGDGFDDLVVSAITSTSMTQSPSDRQTANPHVRVFSGRDGHELTNFATKGVRLAIGDVDGDGDQDIVTSPEGPGVVPIVEVFDGLTGKLLPNELGSFFAYNPLFRGGVYVAVGDVNADGLDDIITGAGNGGGPHVKVFSGLDRSVITEFFAYNPDFRGGARVAVADLDGDGQADIITGAGQSGGPHVRVFSGLDGSDLGQTFAYNIAFTGGIFVAGHEEMSSATICPPALTAQAGVKLSTPPALGINDAQLDAIFAAAIQRFENAGLPAAFASRLAAIDARVTRLPGDELITTRGGRILVDSNAAGHGWFVDPTPLANEEFAVAGGVPTALPATAAAGRLDLLSAVIHELGHVMGLDDVELLTDPASIMADELVSGVRNLPDATDVDAVFAEGEF